MTTCWFDDRSLLIIGGSAEQWLFHLCRIFAFLDHVKEGVDIGRDYNVSKWADIMILACDSNRFNRVKQSLPTWKSSKNPKITILTDACLVWAPCWLRLPWRTSRKKGWRWKLFSIFYLDLSLSLQILLNCVCTYVWDVFMFVVMCVVWCLDTDINVYLLAKSLWCNNPR